VPSTQHAFKREEHERISHETRRDEVFVDVEVFQSGERQLGRGEIEQGHDGDRFVWGLAPAPISAAPTERAG